MPWYGWLIIGALSVIVIFLIYFLVKKSSSGSIITDKDKQKLISNETTAAKKQIDIEKDLRIKAEDRTKVLSKKLFELLEWRNKQETVIDDKAKKRFDELVSDPDLLGSELDKWLG